MPFCVLASRSAFHTNYNNDKPHKITRNEHIKNFVGNGSTLSSDYTYGETLYVSAATLSGGNLTANMTFGPVALGGLVVGASDNTFETGRTGKNIQMQFAGASGSGVVFNIASNTKLHAGLGFVASGNQNWTIASGKTLSLLDNNTGGGTLTLNENCSMAVSGGGGLSVGGIVTSSGATLTIGADTTLNLSGASVSLASAIQNSGTVTVSGTTVFNLTDSLKNAEGVYTLISNSGSGNITNWDILSWRNFTLAGEALSGRTQITLGAGSVTFSGEAYNLFWKGGNGTWDTTTAANFGKDSVDGAETAFVAGDNVTFSSTATVAVSSGISAKTVHVTGEGTTLTLTSPQNLTADVVNVDQGSTLDLGDLSSNISYNLTGTGTVSLSKTTDGHGVNVDLGTEFAGTINFAGNLQISDAVLGSSSARLNLSSVHIWTGANVTKTLEQAITFSASNKIGGWGFNATLNFSGGLTFTEGASLNVDNTNATNTVVNISGSVTDANITQTSGGTLNITLSGDSTIKSLTQTRGTVAVSGTSATFASATISGKLNITDGVTVFDVLNVAATATDEIDVTGGTSLTIKSGSILKGLHVKTGTEVNIGDGTKASTLTLARLEMGDNEASGGDTLNVRQNATLVITGSDDTTSGDGDPNTGEGSRYKLTGIMLGEWGGNDDREHRGQDVGGKRERVFRR